MSAEEKIKSGKYHMISNWQMLLGFIVLLFSFGDDIYDRVASKSKKDDLTFKNQEEKFRTTTHPIETFHVEATEIVDIKNSIKIGNEHIESLTKSIDKLIENQTKIGQDLQTIKNQN